MPSEPRTEAELLADFWDHIDTDLPHAAHRLASLKAHWQAEAAQGALDDVRALVADDFFDDPTFDQRRGFEAAIKAVLAALQDRGADREDVKP